MITSQGKWVTQMKRRSFLIFWPPLQLMQRYRKQYLSKQSDMKKWE